MIRFLNPEFLWLLARRGCTGRVFVPDELRRLQSLVNDELTKLEAL